MDDIDKRLRSFGIDPEWVRKEIGEGREKAVLAALDEAEEMLELQLVELEDLREEVCAMAESFRTRGGEDEGRLSDEELEMLNAAGTFFDDGRFGE